MRTLMRSCRSASLTAVLGKPSWRLLVAVKKALCLLTLFGVVDTYKCWSWKGDAMGGWSTRSSGDAVCFCCISFAVRCWIEVSAGLDVKGGRAK